MFKAEIGTLPVAGEGPIEEQLTVVAHLLEFGVPLCVDFSIFGPYAMRLRKRLRLRGLMLGGDGAIERQEMYGPPNIHEWCRCYWVLTTCVTILGAVSPSRLQQYADLVCEYVQRYGPSV